MQAPRHPPTIDEMIDAMIALPEPGIAVRIGGIAMTGAIAIGKRTRTGIRDVVVNVVVNVGVSVYGKRKRLL